MGLLQGHAKVSLSEKDLAYSEDPDVKVPDDLVGCGWVETDRCQISKGADVVRIRILTPSEERERVDIAQTAPEKALHYALSAAVLAHNGDKKKSANAAWLDALYLSNGGTSGNNRPGSTAWRLLAYRILTETNGKPLADYHAMCRALLGYEQPEEVADDGATKSGDVAG